MKVKVSEFIIFPMLHLCLTMLHIMNGNICYINKPDITETLTSLRKVHLN